MHVAVLCMYLLFSWYNAWCCHTWHRRRRTFSEGHYHSLRQQTTPDGISPSACATPRVPVITAHSPNPIIKTHLESNINQTLKFWVTTVSTSDELLAATTLRAQLFYSYRKQPDLRMDDRIESMKERVAHDFLVTNLLRSRIKSEYNRVCAKLLISSVLASSTVWRFEDTPFLNNACVVMPCRLAIQYSSEDIVVEFLFVRNSLQDFSKCICKFWEHKFLVIVSHTAGGLLKVEGSDGTLSLPCMMEVIVWDLRI